MRWVEAVLLLVVLVGGVAVAGAFLPREHQASVRVALDASPDAAWIAVSDLERWPEWNPAVKISRLPDSPEGRSRFAWEQNGDVIPTEVVSATNGVLVTRILDEGLPFGGTWTWEIAPAAKGCTVTVTEDGFVKNTIFRFLAHHVFGHTSSMESTLAALSKELGGAAPEVVAGGR